MSVVVESRKLEALDIDVVVDIWCKNPPRVRGVDGYFPFRITGKPGDGGVVLESMTSCAQAYEEQLGSQPGPLRFVEPDQPTISNP